MIIWKCFSLLFCYFIIFSEAVSQRTPEVVSQMCSVKKLNTFWEEHIWGTASETLEIDIYYFLSVQFYLCPHFWQIYFKCFLHTALLQCCNSFWLWPDYFCFPYTFPVVVFLQWHRFLSLASYILTSAAFGDSTTFETLCIFVTTVCSNPTELAKWRVICTFTRSIPNCQMKLKVRMSSLISLKTVCGFFRAMSST